MEKKLERLPNDGVIAGVAAGIGVYFNIDVTVIRILFIVFGFVTFGTAPAILYFVLWMIMPVSGNTTAPDIEDTVKEMKDKVDQVVKVVKERVEGNKVDEAEVVEEKKETKNTKSEKKDSDKEDSKKETK